MSETRIDRPDGPTSGARTRLRLLGWVTLSMIAATAHAGPIYKLAFRQGGLQIVNTSATPLRLSDAFSADASTSVTSQGYAVRGLVGMDNAVTSNFTGLDAYTALLGASADASTDDFIITGPAGPTTVAGTMYFTVGITLQRSGGFPGNGGHHAYGAFMFSCDVGTSSGDVTSGNGSTLGTGFLAGYSPATHQVVTSISGSFPVGTPFSVRNYLQAFGQTYGNELYAPGFCRSILSGVIGDPGGRVMDLPAGYSVSSINWGISSSQAVGVGAPVVDARLSLTASPNPSRDATALSFRLPRDGMVRLRILDITGRVVRDLAGEWLEAGLHERAWSGRDDAGRVASPGLYFATLSTADGSRALRIVRTR